MAEPTQQEVTRVVAGYENAVGAIAYEATLVLDTELIADEDYKMIWSTKYERN